MQFYTKTHEYYCGIDLHTKMMYVCILNNLGGYCVTPKYSGRPVKLLKLVAPFRDDVDSHTNLAVRYISMHRDVQVSREGRKLEATMWKRKDAFDEKYFFKS